MVTISLPKLVKHMNTVFALSKRECLSIIEKASIEKYTDDNFFKALYL